MNNNLNIRNEEILLIGLCRLEFSSEHTEKLKSRISGTADWKYFADLANAHGVGALAYHNLEKLGYLRYLPEEIAKYLHNILMLSLTRNTRHMCEMKGVLNLLNKADIKTVLLKGLALEMSVYGNKGLRQMTDVDVLISKENCIKAWELLITDGFESLPVKSFFHNLIIAHTGKHLPSLFRNGFSIEIHHELFGAGKNDLTIMLYEDTFETEIDGERTYIPKAQLFFLYLVKHLQYHEMNNESQLRLYTDLAVLIDRFREEIINKDLPGLADKAGMSEIVAWKLEILRDFWGISFPGFVDDLIIKWHNPDSAEKFLFFLNSPKNNPSPEKALPYRNTLKEIQGIHRKMLFLMGDLFPSINFMKKRYNCSSGWKALLYYPHRLGKLWYLIKS
jgi:hypothetical protein